MFTGTLTESSLENSRFDVVTFWSALEHTTDPRMNLLEARRLVKPGGPLIVQLPNAASFQARLFEGDWFALDAPRHRFHFAPPVLKRLLTETGFDVYRATHFSKAHNSPALRQSLKVRLGTTASSKMSLVLFFGLALVLDVAMSVVGKGATMTVAALAV